MRLKSAMRSRINEPLVAEVVDLPTFKKFIKWDITDPSEDYVMNTCISAAVEHAEQYTRRAIVRSTWNGYLDSFTNTCFDVFPVDLDSIVVSYYNDSNVLTVLSSSEYEVINNGPDCFAGIRFTGTMPELYDRNEPIVINYTAGYSELPYKIELGILQYAATYFEQRTNEVVGTGVAPVSHNSYVNWWAYKMFD